MKREVIRNGWLQVQILLLQPLIHILAGDYNIAHWHLYLHVHGHIRVRFVLHQAQSALPDLRDEPHGTLLGSQLHLRSSALEGKERE